MTDDNVTKFPGQPVASRKRLHAHEVEVIGFLTFDDRDLYIEDPADIERIMKFIALSGIKITIGF